MSFDELPPDPATRPESVSTGEGKRDESPSDAPPAAPVRRRRTKAAGTDAASVPDATPPDKPVRAARSRKPKVPEESVPSIVETPAVPSIAAVEAGEKVTSRRRTVRKTTVEAVPETMAPTPEPPKPARPSRRKKATPPEVTAETPVVESPAPEPVAETPAVLEETVPGRPSRRRSARSRKEPVAAEPLPELPVAAAPVVSEPLSETKEDEKGTNRRRRGGRTRRRGTEPGEATEPETTPAEPIVAVPESETVTDDETTPGRSRSRRRGGRSRRGKGEVESPIVTDTVEALADGVVVPMVEEEPPVDTSVGAHLLSPNGVPEIFIDGVVFPPVLFFGNLEEEGNRAKVRSEIRRAAAAGVHLHSTLVELPCPFTESSDALDIFTNRIRTVLEADPDGYVMPRIVFTPARGWKREYPNDIAVFADGATGDPSITSERFWQEAEHSLTMLIAHVREHRWGERIFGYHLEKGEWFLPADQGYDRSMANRDAFRDWLRDKYNNNLVSLRGAWYDGEVQFHTAEIPPVQTKPNPLQAFYETRRERGYIDFNEFTSESTAKRLTALAKTVKRACEGKALVSVCYGYTLEFGHPSSGHLALATLLASPHINLICGPPSYRDRRAGGAASLPSPVDSMALHGKLFLSEDDTKTYLAPVDQDPEDFNPRLGDKFATEQAQLRAIGRTFTHNIGVGWMDLWGEGWLDDESIWARLGQFVSDYRKSRAVTDRPETPEVIALIDEKSLLHVQRGEAFFRRLTNGLRDTLQRAGVSIGFYLQSDVTAPNFPTDAKLYLFLTPYRLNTEQRLAIQERLQNGGKTLAWLFAPGSCTERPGSSGLEETAAPVVGMILRPQEWNSEIGSRVLAPNHPVMERLPGRDIGTKERLNPSFYVEDPDATVLAEYQGSGLPSIAVRDFGTWKSVFVGEPFLPLELLRGLCKYAGVHQWANAGEDVLSAGNGWLMVHAGRDGQRVLRLPRGNGLYDMMEQRVASEGAGEFRYFQRGGTTRLFCVGNRARFEALGLPLHALPPPVERKPRIPLERPSFEEAVEKLKPRLPAPETAPPSLRADLETLEAVLNLDLSLIDGFTDDEDEVLDANEESDPEAGEEEGEESLLNGRRRRRRGGRGRGRRRLGSISETKDGAEPPAGESPPSGETAAIPFFPDSQE